MPGELTATQPELDDATRSFVRRSLAAGLTEVGDLKKVIVSLMADDHRFTPQRLADGLVGASILTQWQADKLLAGKSKGFFLGSYRLLRPLGKGGMGVVYLGQHQVMQKLVALKILPPEASKDPRRIQRFQSEARACAQLDHPNIVQAYDFSEAGGKLFIVMEYVDGVDLHLAIRRDGVMSVSTAVDVLTQATQGLAHAHERGILHRDVKPSNLLLRTDGVIKVSDLGLARIGWSDDGPQRKRQLMGTADFVSPEQAINPETVDTRGDIYSLGCTLYFLLVGRPPFDGSAEQKLARHQTAPVPDVRVERKDVPNSIGELVFRMMAKRREDRPKSAVELLAQLQRLGCVKGPPAERAIRPVAPADDTAFDDAIYQASIADTSLSSDGGIVVSTVDADDIDFGSLPPVDWESSPAPPSRSVMVSKSNSGKNSKSKKKPSAATIALSVRENQHLLLGVGLAFAVIALLGVLGLGVHAMFRPLQQTQPKLKSVEDGNGGKLIILEK